MKAEFLFMWFCLLMPWSMAGQQPRFLQHDLGEAANGITIQTMIQDHQCMIWLGTNQGLAMFDGLSLSFVDLPSAQQDEISQVTALYEDHQYRIWIGTSTGEIFFLDAARGIHAFQPEEGHPKVEITAIAEDEQKQLWIATYGEGVYVYTGSRLFNFNADDGLTGDDIYDLAVSAKDYIWLATDNGISVCTFENEVKHIHTIGLDDGLPDQIITALLADSQGGVYAGTFEKGVVYFSSESARAGKHLFHPSMDEVTTMALFDNKEVWIGTRAAGLWRYFPGWESPAKVTPPPGIKMNQVSEIYTDVEGNIWVGLQERGLLSAFRPFECIKTDIGDIQALTVDHLNRLWIGTKQGLYRLKKDPLLGDTILLEKAGAHLNITDIEEDRFHQLWIGTLDNGLYVYNPASGSMRSLGSIFERGGITIMSIASSAKKIWIATLEGVVSYPSDKNVFRDPAPSFSLIHNPWQSNLHFVFQVYVDSRDRVWFATDGNGVFCMNGDSVTQYTGNDSISLRSVYSVTEDYRGHFWFNSSEAGLVEFDGTDYAVVGYEQGLSSLKMASIQATGNKDVLIAHHRGIDLMEPDRRHFMYYGEEIGAKEIEPGLNAIAVDSNKSIFIACRNQIFKYYATASKLSIHPRTQLMRVMLFEKQVDWTQQNSFSFGENYLTFDYVGLWYTSPGSVKYLYKLDGYDLSWKESKDHRASYSHLQPGDYTFYVKASENNFFLDEPIASYSFTINPPFWTTPWFIIGLTAATCFMIWWLVKVREDRSRRQAMLKKEMVESQLAAVKAQINPHFLFNSFNTLITIIDENAHTPDVPIEYVEKLADFYRSILLYREQESIPLAEEYALVKNFGYLLEKRYGSDLRLHLDQPANESYILPLTLQILVENAVKHNVISTSHPLDVTISQSPAGYVSVTNTLQPKSKPEPSTQFGLQSIIKQYQLLSHLNVIVEPGPKEFRVSVPLLKLSKQ